jgi:hypothetical protein
VHTQLTSGSAFISENVTGTGSSSSSTSETAFDLHIYSNKILVCAHKNEMQSLLSQQEMFLQLSAVQFLDVLLQENAEYIVTLKLV